LNAGRAQLQVPRMTLAVNILLFETGWFACALGAAHGMPWVGPLGAAVIIVWHLARAAQPGRELALVAVVAVLGALFETLLVRAGWVRFETGVLIEGTAPYWMVALWAIFATTLNVSLRSLRPYPGLGAIVGAIGGPIAYYAGARLGALEFSAPVPALAAIGIGWAILTPALLLTARRLDGVARP
jgi:hypothetical protein